MDNNYNVIITHFGLQIKFNIQYEVNWEFELAIHKNEKYVWSHTYNIQEFNNIFVSFYCFV